MLWIEAHPTPEIALLVFGFWYGLAALIFAVTAMLSRWRLAPDLKSLTPVILTPLSVITGLLIGFLSSRVWANLDHAHADVAAEAAAIHETLLYADALPGDVQGAVRADIRRYLAFVDAQDWPAMQHGQADLRQPPPALRSAMATLLSFAPQSPGQDIAQQRAVSEIDQALEARQQRILLSQAVIAPLQWAVIVILGALLLSTMALVHIDRRATIVAGLFILATALAACLVLLAVNDRPFAAGGYMIEPVVLHQIGPD